MKRTDKNVTINIFSGNNFTVDGKTAIVIVIIFVCLALVVSCRSPELLANVIRLLISMAENY